MKTRKNKKLLVVVAMVLMIGLVAGMGAMTYSKYISSAKIESQTATAAKWGFVVTASAENMFGTDYVAPSENSLATVVTTNGVAVNAANIVVAPGTTGSMTCSIKGTAEVLAQIVVDFDLVSDIHYKNYYPIKWQINGAGAWYTTADLQTALDALSTVYKPGVSDPLNIDYEIAWKWDLVDETDGLNGENRNAEDTIIGLKANGASLEDINKALGLATPLTSDDISAANLSVTLEFSLAINVEQIQVDPTP